MKLQLIVKRAPVASAMAWIKQAWQLFLINPGLFIAVNLVLVLIGILAAVPVIGMVILFVLPFLQAGFYSMIVAAQQQKPLEFAMLWKPFQIAEIRAPLIRMAAAQLICSLPALYFMEQLVAQWNVGQVDLLQVLLVVVCHTINLMLFAYAVPIIYFLRENRIYPVIQASVTACWRNVLPLTLFAVLSVSIILTAIVFISLLSQLAPILGQILIVPAIVVMIPVFAIAFFLSFSEFFALIVSKDQPSEVFEV